MKKEEKLAFLNKGLTLCMTLNDSKVPAKLLELSLPFWLPLMY